MRIHDISPPIHAGLPVWPGDVPYAAKTTMDWDAGHHLALGAIESTVHVGAHTDAPRHYHPDGETIDQVPLSPYVGRCEVVEVRATRGERFGADNLASMPDAPRVLFKTGTFPEPTHWNKDFAAPEPKLIEHLGAAGVVLVGFDTPSTDLMSSKGLPAHQALRKHGMMNLEGLDLRKVPAGSYTLVALPLPLVGMDASPVRAVLLEDFHA